MRRLLPVLVLYACNDTPDKSDDPVETDDTTVVDTVDTVDTDATVDTDPDDTGTALPTNVWPDDVVVQTSGVITCADPSGRDAARYDLVTAQTPVQTDPPSYTIIGGGVSSGDVDGDGLLDILVLGPVETQLHIQQPGTTFERQEDTRLAGIDLSDATGANLVDYDGDGDLDLFVIRWREPNLLLENDGSGVFSDVTASTGITGEHRSQTSSWGDMDSDGDLDLFVGNYGPRPENGLATQGFEVADPSQLWENLGDGTFADVSDLFPQDLQDAYTFMSTWQDMDLDGDVDLLIINDFGWARPSRMYWQEPSGLVMDAGGSSGAGFDLAFAGMGVGIADLNGDEIPDFLQSSWREISLLVSRGGFWVEEAEARSLAVDYEFGGPRQIFGWGAELADIDNDGDDDGIVNFGYWETYAEVFEQRDALFLQDDAGHFSDVAPEWGLDDPEYNRGLLVADLNDDGLLDLVKRRLNGGSPMHLSRCDDSNWIRVRPRMPGPNTHAIGGRVRVVAGDRVWTRTLTVGGTSMYTTGPAEVHIGLGDVERVDAVEIVWPGGAVSTLERVDSRQILDVTLQ